MHAMLNIFDQESDMDYIFDANELKEIISHTEFTIIDRCGFDDSVEIDEMQIDKIYQSL
jgi:hypothetical protein